MKYRVTKHCRAVDCEVWMVSRADTHAVVQWSLDWREALDWTLARIKREALTFRPTSQWWPFDPKADVSGWVTSKEAWERAAANLGLVDGPDGQVGIMLAPPVAQLMERATTEWPKDAGTRVEPSPDRPGWTRCTNLNTGKWVETQDESKGVVLDFDGVTGMTPGERADLMANYWTAVTDDEQRKDAERRAANNAAITEFARRHGPGVGFAARRRSLLAVDGSNPANMAVFGVSEPDSDGPTGVETPVEDAEIAKNVATQGFSSSGE